MGIAERREREKRQIRQQILEAAMELFVEEAYGNVSIRKIEGKLGSGLDAVDTFYEALMTEQFFGWPMNAVHYKSSAHQKHTAQKGVYTDGN